MSTWKHSAWLSWYDKKVDPNDITNVVDGTNLEERLHPCQHFLVDSATERARNKISFEVLAKLNTTKVGGTVDHFFKNSKFALKVNKVFGIILKKQKNEDSDFFMHTKKTRLDRFTLVSIRDYVTKLEDLVDKTDIIHSWKKERLNTKWISHKLTEKTIFAALLKNLHKGCQDVVLAKFLLKNHTVNSLFVRRGHGKTMKRQRVPFFVHLHCLCAEASDSTEKFEKFSSFSSKTRMDSASINSKISAWTIF